MFSLKMLSGNKDCLICCLNVAPKFLSFCKGVVVSVCNYNAMKVCDGVHLKLCKFLILAIDGGQLHAMAALLLEKVLPIVR
jgi:hypothetical protein